MSCTDAWDTRWTTEVTEWQSKNFRRNQDRQSNGDMKVEDLHDQVGVHKHQTKKGGEGSLLSYHKFTDKFRHISFHGYYIHHKYKLERCGSLDVAGDAVACRGELVSIIRAAATTPVCCDKYLA